MLSEGEKRMPPVNPSARMLRLLWPTLTLFCLWCALLLGIPVLLGAGPLADPFTWAFTLCYLLLMACSCALCTVFQEPQWHDHEGWRRWLLMTLFIMAAVLFAALRQGLVFGPWAEALLAAKLLVFALLLGNYLVTALNRPAELVAVCMVMSVADLLSVLAGPSRGIAASIEAFYLGDRLGLLPWSDFLLVKIALPGYDYLLPIFGLADLIMVAFFIGAAHKFGIEDNLFGAGLQRMVERRRPGIYLPLPMVGVAVAVLLAQWLHIFIPALPVVAVVFLGVTFFRDRRLRLLQRTERLAILLSCVILGVFWAVSLLTAS
jgi:hypothetical protein